eukprot:gene23020-35271_t
MRFVGAGVPRVGAFRVLGPLVAVAVLAVEGANEHLCDQDVLTKILDGYNPLSHPSTAAGPVKVKVTGTVTKINIFNTKEQTFRLNMYFRHQWVDERLAWNPDDYCGNVTQLDNMAARLFWRPDSFFATANEVGSPDAEESVRVASTGTLLWSKRIVLTLFCAMDFTYYPFDDQSCIASVESYAYGPEVMQYVMPDPGDRYNHALKFLDDEVGSVLAYVLDDPEAEIGTSTVGGNSFSKVVYRWRFYKKKLRYIVTVFSQLWLVGLMSFVGMYVDYGVAPARVALALFSVLTMMNLLTRLQTDVPVVPYITAMDVMTLLSICFVVANAVEYCVLNFVMTLIKRKEAQIAELKRRRGPAAAPAPRRLCALEDFKMATAECKEIFKLFDPAGTGEITGDEFRALAASVAADRGRSPPAGLLDKQAEFYANSPQLTFRRVNAAVNGYGELSQSVGMSSEIRSCIYVCGRPIVKTAVEQCESLYRTWALLAYAVANFLWFIIVLSQDNAVAVGVSVPVIGLYLAGLAYHVRTNFAVGKSFAPFKRKS